MDGERGESNRKTNLNDRPFLYELFLESVTSVTLERSILFSSIHILFIYLIALVLHKPLFSNGKSEHSFSSDGQSLTLTTETREITQYYGEGKLVMYSVYVDGKFLHSIGSGGRLRSCGRNLPKVYNLGSNEQQIGWMIVGYGVCGNTVSYNIELIVPNPFPDTNRYVNKNFISKSIPHFLHQEKKPEVWFYLQNWGRGNTSECFFVPRKFVIDRTNWGVGIKKGNLFRNIDWFEEQIDDRGLELNFLGLYTAGIEDLNPLIMLYALENYFEDEEIEWYKIHYPNCSRESFLELVNEVTNARRLYNKTDRVLTWDTPDIKKLL